MRLTVRCGHASLTPCVACSVFPNLCGGGVGEAAEQDGQHHGERDAQRTLLGLRVASLLASPGGRRCLGALGGVIYIAAHNKGETIAPPAAVLLPIPIGALVGYIIRTIADETLYRRGDP